MANGFKVGMFTAAYSGGLPQDQSVTGVGFQPKALILFTAGLLTADGNVGPDEAVGFGISDGTASQSYGWWTDTAAATSSCVFQWRPKIIVNALSAATPLWYDADLKSFDTDGFTVTWTSDNGGFLSGREMYYIAFGGDDITNVKLHKPVTQSGTGNKSYTGVGFQPDIIFVLNQNIVASTDDGGVNDVSCGLGVGISATKRWALAHCMRTGQTMSTSVNAQSYQRTDSIYLTLLPSTGVENSRFDLVSLDSDGYTFNQIVHGDTAGINSLAVLCIKGGQWDIGSLLAPATASDTSVTGLAFSPDGALFASDSFVASTSVQSDSRFMLGAGDTDTNRVARAQAVDVIDTITSRSREAKAIDLFSSLSKASVSALNADGFTLTWNPMSAGQENFQVLWVAAKLTLPEASITGFRFKMY